MIHKQFGQKNFFEKGKSELIYRSTKTVEALVQQNGNSKFILV